MRMKKVLRILRIHVTRYTEKWTMINSMLNKYLEDHSMDTKDTSKFMLYSIGNKQKMFRTLSVFQKKIFRR